MQYKTGTVDVTNGSSIVTGVGTSWMNEVEAGDLFTVASSGVFYQVAAVNNNNELELSSPYAGATESGVSYTIARDFTPLNNIPEMSKGDIETAAIFTRAMRRIDQVLSLNQDAGALTSAGVYPDTTTGISNTSDGDYFFVPETDEFVLYLNDSGTAVEQLRFASLATALQYAQDASAAATSAQTAQSEAETARDEAEGFATDAETSATNAAQSEANAASSEDLASQQATVATTQATRAVDAAERAEDARDAANLSTAIYDNTSDGLANTAYGEYFSTPSGDSEVYLILYKNDNGSALEIARYPTIQGIMQTVGEVVHLDSNSTYTLPASQSNGTKYTFTKSYSVTPTIQASGSDTITAASVVDTELEFDVDMQLVMVYQSGTWEVMYD